MCIVYVFIVLCVFKQHIHLEAFCFYAQITPLGRVASEHDCILDWPAVSNHIQGVPDNLLEIQYVQTFSIHCTQEEHLIMWLVVLNFPPP